jgi:hypothetical protein
MGLFALRENTTVRARVAIEEPMELQLHTPVTNQVVKARMMKHYRLNVDHPHSILDLLTVHLNIESVVQDPSLNLQLC